ncbi:MAG: RDD family protein [Planctomycetes bacterium]|nr:RDD family protein [Planctomycetota bacterium]
MTPLRVSTPEGVAVDLQPAGVGRRCCAALADLLLVLSLVGLAELVARLLGATIGTLVATTAGFVLFWGYHVVCELRWGGRSLGKLACGLRVVDACGLPLTPAQSVLRSVVRAADLLPGSGGVGLAAVLADPHGRRLGDLVAGTLVVAERAPRPLPAALAAGLRHNSLDTPLLRRRIAARIGLEERELLIDFLLRADGLTPEARLSLGTRLGERLGRILELGDGHPQGENLVRAVVPLC